MTITGIKNHKSPQKKTPEDLEQDAKVMLHQSLHPRHRREVFPHAKKKSTNDENKHAVAKAQKHEPRSIQ
jgi:hypothetical protein